MVSFKSDGIIGSGSGKDTVEMFLTYEGSIESDKIHNINWHEVAFTPNYTGNYYFRFDINQGNTSHIFYDIQVEEGSTPSSYEPFKTNILTVNEEVELRGVGDVQDELNLLTGDDFIVFSNIDNYCLGLGTDSKCKVKEWIPRVQGYCAGIIVSDRPKVQTIDLSEYEIRNGLLNIETSGVKSIVEGRGEGVQVVIKKNKNLDKLDIKRIKNCMNPGSWIVDNKNLEIKPDELPTGIRVKNNKLKEKIYIS